MLSDKALGFGPFVKGGTRIEKEKIDGMWVVHNYGAGGAGYQSFYGWAKDTVSLIEEVCGFHARL